MTDWNAAFQIVITSLTVVFTVLTALIMIMHLMKLLVRKQEKMKTQSDTSAISSDVKTESGETLTGEEVAAITAAITAYMEKPKELPNHVVSTSGISRWNIDGRIDQMVHHHKMPRRGASSTSKWILEARRELMR